MWQQHKLVRLSLHMFVASSGPKKLVRNNHSSLFCHWDQVLSILEKYFSPSLMWKQDKLVCLCHHLFVASSGLKKLVRSNYSSLFFQRDNLMKMFFSVTNVEAT
jgi:hypothetical protein